MCHRRQNSVIDFEKYGKLAVNFMRNLPKSLQGADMDYMSLSLWKMDELHIYESFFKPAITGIEIIRKIIDVEKPSRLIDLNSSSRMGMIQKLINCSIQIEDRTDFISRAKQKFFSFLMPFAVRTI